MFKIIERFFVAVIQRISFAIAFICGSVAIAGLAEKFTPEAVETAKSAVGTLVAFLPEGGIKEVLLSEFARFEESFPLLGTVLLVWCLLDTIHWVVRPSRLVAFPTQEEFVSVAELENKKSQLGKLAKLSQKMGKLGAFSRNGKFAPTENKVRQTKQST